MALLEKEAKSKAEAGPQPVVTSLSSKVVVTNVRPQSKERSTFDSSTDFTMSKSGGISGYKRNQPVNIGGAASQTYKNSKHNNSDLMMTMGQKSGNTLDHDEQSISTAMSNFTSSRIGSSGDDTQTKARIMRAGSGKQSYLSAANLEDTKDSIYELSLNKTAKPKPQKLQPLVGKTANLAKSLLEDDPKPSYLDGLNEKVSAEIDSDIKSYLDTNQIFKQLKSAFDPTA